MKLAFEQQRLPSSKKDKKWAENTMDAVCARADEFSEDWFRMYQNYRLKNNQIDQSEYQEYCDTLGLKNEEGQRFVEPFNKTHTIIDVLVGEESSMPWNFNLTNLSPEATNEILREKRRMFRMYVDERMEAEIEKQQMLTQAVMSGNTDPKLAEEANRKFQAKMEKILSPEQIENKFANYKSVKEQAMFKLLQSVVVDQNLQWVKNQTFEDALIAGVEAVEITQLPHSGMPRVKEVNVLNLFYHKSPDEPFIHYGSYAGYKEESSVTDVLDTYGEKLSDEQVKKIRSYNRGSMFGTENGFFNEKSVDHWETRKQYEYGELPYWMSPGFGTGNVWASGLRTTDRRKRMQEGYVIVYTCYWKSYRKIGVITTNGEWDIEEHEFVGEDFKVPKRAEKISEKKAKYDSTKTTVYHWKEHDGRDRYLKWIWVPEIWKGVRINGDIHVYAEPLEHAYQSLENPYKTKLPIMGYIYNNRNALSLSIMDRMKPWQKLYYIVAAKWLKLISQDKGVWSVINALMLDKDMDIMQSLQFANDQATIISNPLSHKNGGAVNNTSKAVESINLSNTQQLQYYTTILEFIERQQKLAAGVSEQRLAQTSASSNVTDNQRDMAQSMNITSAIFSGHNLLWQEILQALCETIAKAVHSKKNIVRQILSDDEISLINLDLISMEDDYAIKVNNSSKHHKVLQEARGMAQALLQNDKASFSTFVELLDTENLSEFKEHLKEIEATFDKRAQQSQQQTQQQEQQAQQKALQENEKARQHEINLAKIKGEYDIKGKQIAAMSWSEDKDVDKDGLPDVMEIENFHNQVRKDNAKIQQDQQKLTQEQEKLDIKRQEMSSKKGKESLDNSNKNRELSIKQQQVNNQKNKPKS